MFRFPRTLLKARLDLGARMVAALKLALSAGAPQLKQPKAERESTTASKGEPPLRTAAAKREAPRGTPPKKEMQVPAAPQRVRVRTHMKRKSVETQDTRRASLHQLLRAAMAEPMSVGALVEPPKPRRQPVARPAAAQPPSMKVQSSVPHRTMLKFSSQLLEEKLSQAIAAAQLAPAAEAPSEAAAPPRRRKSAVREKKALFKASDGMAALERALGKALRSPVMEEVLTAQEEVTAVVKEAPRAPRKTDASAVKYLEKLVAPEPQMAEPLAERLHAALASSLLKGALEHPSEVVVEPVGSTRHAEPAAHEPPPPQSNQSVAESTKTVENAAAPMQEPRAEEVKEPEVLSESAAPAEPVAQKEGADVADASLAAQAEGLNPVKDDAAYVAYLEKLIAPPPAEEVIKNLRIRSSKTAAL